MKIKIIQRNPKNFSRKPTWNTSLLSKETPDCRSSLMSMVAELFKCFSLQSLYFFLVDGISFAHFLIASAFIITMVLYYTTRVPCVYLLDFNCYHLPDNLRVVLANFIEFLERNYIFDRESIDFQVKILERVAVGNESCLCFFKWSAARDWSSFYNCERRSKHKIDPKRIDILVSNCTIFCPTPSITAMVIKKFGFWSDIKSFDLSGMGCSAGILSISLVKDLLKVHKLFGSSAQYRNGAKLLHPVFIWVKINLCW